MAIVFENNQYSILLDARTKFLKPFKPNQTLANKLYEPRSLDPYLDLATDENYVEEEEKKRKENTPSYIKRKIDFPYFKNLTSEQAEQHLFSKDTGDIVIRPSTRGLNYLMASWKISHDPFLVVHVEIKEKNKPNPFGVGKNLLIGKLQFEDLDDIHHNYFEKMNHQLRVMVQFRCFRYGTENELRKFVQDDRRNMPHKIPYSIGLSNVHQGWFKLYYIFRLSVREEFIGITPDGFRFRKLLHKKPEQLIQ